MSDSDLNDLARLFSEHFAEDLRGAEKLRATATPRREFETVACTDPSLLLKQPWLNPFAALKAWQNRGVRMPIFGPEFPVSEYWARHAEECQEGRLEPMARLFGKDVRTIRRYCEAGVIPKAFTRRTAGGHWRIDYTSISNEGFSAIRRAVEALEPEQAYSGKPDDTTEKAWLAHSHHLAVRPDGALKPGEVETMAQREQLGVKREPTPAHFAETSREFSALVTAAFHLRRDGQKPTAKALAKKLGVSRATLYNRFSRAQIRSAISASGQMRAVAAAEAEHFDFEEIDARLGWKD